MLPGSERELLVLSERTVRRAARVAPQLGAARAALAALAQGTARVPQRLLQPLEDACGVGAVTLVKPCE
jgi:hypothetical protein